ncbi:hypothetical protein CL622_03485 [archaeon]|nr:hypothetical protein [archaeon]|tara:strand:- start:178 stop:504 length:327 start_codon:yes stop_codon:yes gene_type:complete
MRIDIKPVTVNKAYTGRRYKTDLYKRYERDVKMLLSPFDVPEGNLELRIVFGFSNAGADIDNPVKCFTDILQKKYGFNDNRIYRLIVDKVIVAKGEEFIDFEIKEFVT